MERGTLVQTISNHIRCTLVRMAEAWHTKGTTEPRCGPRARLPSPLKRRKGPLIQRNVASKETLLTASTDTFGPDRLLPCGLSSFTFLLPVFPWPVSNCIGPLLASYWPSQVTLGRITHAVSVPSALWTLNDGGKLIWQEVGMFR